ncbi:hypothetical protein K8I28_03680, partial [bacterium]|nr:hypothetical protein [bacterium]
MKIKSKFYDMAFIGLTLVLFWIFLASENHDQSGSVTRTSFLEDRNLWRGAVKQPDEWFLRQRLYPYSQFPTNAFTSAQKKASLLRGIPSELDEEWVFRGPNNIGGRITSLAVHPDQTSIVYAGAALGGVFKSTNGGYTYSNIFQGEYSSSSGALTVDSNDPE